MTLDLSDLSFMRSDPEDRNRSDRTMSSRAMLAVVDSLYREIDSQVSLAGNDISLNPTEDNEGQGSFFVQQRMQNVSQGEPISPIESSYLISSNFDNANTQQSLLAESARQLTEYKNQFESIHSNIEWRERRIARYLVEVHKKLSIPFACVVFILFGAPVGIMTKRGNFGFAALISTVVLTFYWVALIQGEKLADRMVVSPLVGMWTFNVILSVAGMYLIFHLATGFSIKNIFKKSDQ